MAGYVIEHEGMQFDPDGRTNVEDAVEHNRQLEAAELAYWQTKPDRTSAYIFKRDSGVYEPTTWRGTALGTIVERRSHKNNLTGTRMTYVKIRGNNGATYYGTFGSDWSQLVRLRKMK